MSRPGTRSRVRTLVELTADGVPPGTAQTRARRGRWTRLLPAVYAVVAPSEVTVEMRCVAVCRWRPDAVLSHRTASWLWGMLPEPDVVEATVPRGVRLRSAPPWLRVVRRDLAASSITRVETGPVVTPERALLDCAAVLPAERMAELADQSLGRVVAARAVRQRQLADLGMHGSAAGHRLLVAAAPAARSEPERRLARSCRRLGVRTLLPHHPVLGYVGDLVDPDAKVVVEVDGLAFHSAPVVFAADRRRQDTLVTAG